MVVSSEMILAIISILSVLVTGLLAIGKRQSDARVKDAEARATDAETRATAAKTELTKAQGDAAQQTGLIETLRALVKVNEANAEAGREIVKAIKEGNQQDSDNYREVRKQMDANTSFLNSNVISVGDRVGELRKDLLRAIERLPKLIDDANYDKVNEMLTRLEMVVSTAAANTTNVTQILPLVVAQEEQKVGGNGTSGADRTPTGTE